MIQKMFEGNDTVALYYVPLFKQYQKTFQKQRFCIWCPQMFNIVSWYLFSYTPNGKPAVSFDSTESHTGIWNRPKKWFGFPPMSDQTWDFYWKSPNILRWNSMLRSLVQCCSLNVHTPAVKQCHYRFKLTEQKQNTWLSMLLLCTLSAVERSWLFECWQPVMFCSVGIGNFSLRNVKLIF